MSEDIERIQQCSARIGSFIHRFFDRVNIRLRCTVEPRGVHAQHYLDAVSVLLRDPEQILSQYELPGHRGMPRVIGAAPTNIERLDALAPAPAGDFRVADRTAIFEKEQVPVVARRLNQTPAHTHWPVRYGKCIC